MTITTTVTVPTRCTRRKPIGGRGRSPRHGGSDVELRGQGWRLGNGDSTATILEVDLEVAATSRPGGYPVVARLVASFLAGHAWMETETSDIHVFSDAELDNSELRATRLIGLSLVQFAPPGTWHLRRAAAPGGSPYAASARCPQHPGEEPGPGITVTG